MGAGSFLIGTTVSVGCQCIFLLLFLPLCVSEGAIECWETVNATFKFLTKPRRKRIERIPTPWEHFVLKLSDTALKLYEKFIGEEGEWPLNPIVVAFQLILWIYLRRNLSRLCSFCHCVVCTINFAAGQERYLHQFHSLLRRIEEHERWVFTLSFTCRKSRDF